MLPKEADGWTMECRSIVMLHELSHVKRRDCLMQGLAQLACAIYWFNPLVWIAAWRLRVERELACDDHVLEAGAKASDYASQLVEIASSFGVANCGLPVAVGMACSHLESRVRSILDPNARRRGVNGL
ncbi:MAG: M56 family metallopeptidase, partial [Blastocatellia bacterium]